MTFGQNSIKIMTFDVNIVKTTTLYTNIVKTMTFGKITLKSYDTNVKNI